MREETFGFPSADQKTTAHGVLWLPEEPAVAVVQILHGMSEYIERYREFARFLNEHSIAVIGHDHLGHGHSVNSEKDLGYFEKKNPNATVVRDIHRVHLIGKKRFPDIPYILFGHSMGSFLARQYLCEHGKDLDGAIICGTGTIQQSAVTVAKGIASLLARTRGGHHISPMLVKLSTGGYNKTFEPRRTDFDWLSVNTDNVDRYIADPLCGFPFTVNGYLGMFTGIEKIQNPENLAKMPKQLPILFIAGGQDPVGDSGKGVKAAAAAFREAGMQNITCILYPNDRHEILNENDRGHVMEDIWNWMSMHILKQA